MGANMESPVSALRHASVAALRDIEVAPENVAALDEYLALYIDPQDTPANGRCPSCEAGAFTWSDAWGAGYCYRCKWPGRLYHAPLDGREDADLVCHATCNGHRVCEAPRGDHVEHEARWYSMGSRESRVEVELRCPNPTVPPGLSAAWFDSRFKPPEIARFNVLLWAHPDFVTREFGA